MHHHPDALCRSIMSAPAAVLKPTDSLLSALQTMVEKRLPALPVVEGDDHYVGMLARSRLIALAMPRVISHQDEQHPLSHLLQVGFIQDTLADLQQRLDAVAGDPVRGYLDTEVPVLDPDTPLMNAVLFLYRQRNVLPVVEHGKLLGIVSVWDVLARIGRVK
ncbi:MAG: CBS domain-containing protein [Candidatus Accumulibacter sp.]|uniref:CBS domain-containing protein n=1 Tax=Candidatus Accumulibacter affinis TaxID=2954384 RepID=A0A935TG18_9PROT|nr:CBS domain-containing protein [Candidatus Accumulibacter affinis]MBP9804581.1 CBS domain-containing protein [Accumulibacter sp.]